MGDSEKFAAETDRRIEQAQNEAAQKEAQAAEKREALAAELQKLGELLSRNSENSEQAKALGDKAAASAMQLADIRVDSSFGGERACSPNRRDKRGNVLPQRRPRNSLGGESFR